MPYLMEFFLKLFSSNPDEVEHVFQIHDVNVPKESLKKDDLEASLERINSWICNCDQKASFLLAMQGVLVGILISKDAILWLKSFIIVPFIQYWTDKEGCFDPMRFFIALFLLLGTICVFLSMMCMVLSLRAKTNYSKERCDGMVKKSILHYGDIAKMTYVEFCQENVNILNELRSQVYANSRICDRKFEFYRWGVRAFLIALPLSAIALLLVLFA